MSQVFFVEKSCFFNVDPPQKTVFKQLHRGAVFDNAIGWKNQVLGLELEIIAVFSMVSGS